MAWHSALYYEILNATLETRLFYPTAILKVTLLSGTQEGGATPACTK